MENLLTNLEELNVANVYDKIASSFDRTRYKVWLSVSKFLDSINPKINHTILEIGCGNGKNMIYNEKLNIIGCDISEPFINICQEKGLNVFKSDQRKIEKPDNSFDYILSIAVLHHLEKVNDRQIAIDEIVRLLKIGGKAIIQVWSNFKYSEQINENNDFLVNWKNDDNILYSRYYHKFEKDEFRKLFIKDKINILEFYEEKNNFICIIEKI